MGKSTRDSLPTTDQMETRRQTNNGRVESTREGHFEVMNLN